MPSLRRTIAGQAHAPATADTGIARSTPISVPRVRQTFGFATRVRQTLAIAWPSFRTIARSRSGLIFGAVVALMAFAILHEGYMRVPLLSRSEHVLDALITPQPGPLPWLLMPLLIVFWAGELLAGTGNRSRRDHRRGTGAGMGSLPGPVPGLSLVPVAFMTLLMTVGMLVQVSKGYPDLEIGLYLQVLFGLQLADYLQLALFALAVHVVVNQKQVGQLVVLLTLIA